MSGRVEAYYDLIEDVKTTFADVELLITDADLEDEQTIKDANEHGKRLVGLGLDASVIEPFMCEYLKEAGNALLALIAGDPDQIFPYGTARNSLFSLMGWI